MKHIIKTGMCVCAFLCLALCGCSSTTVPPVEGEVSSSAAKSASEEPSSAAASNESISVSSSSTETSTPASASSAVPESSEAPESSASQESFCGSITKAEVSKKNKLLNSPRPFSVDNKNGKITLDVTYESYVDIKTLQNCIVDVEVENGEYQFGGAVNANGSLDLTQNVTLAVTDKNGLTRDYSVEVNRTVYDLPIVNLYLAGGAGIGSIDRDNYSDMSLYIDGSGASGFESTDFLSGGIHGRGHSTWKWSKKPYRIKLNEKAGLLGLPKNKDWILLANYSDKSLIRNIVAYDMGSELDSFVWTPTQYSVDLFVNGEYRGVYALGEQREIAKNKINLTEDPIDPDRGYLIEIGGADGEGLVNGYDKFYVKSGCADNCTFVDPKPKDMTDEQRKFIIDYVNAADQAIVNGENYEDYIDVESFIDWILIHELTCNLDSCFRRSCYITKDRGGKLKMGPIWDFDLAFGNFSMDNPSYNTWITIGGSSEDSYIKVNWCNYLMENEDFRSRLKARWFEVRGRLLEAAEKSIDKNSAPVYRSQAENYKVWQTLGIKAGYESWACANLYTYDMQIEYLRNFITTRAAWIDANI